MCGVVTVNINMEKRNVDDILSDSLPTQSKDLCVQKWRQFLDFIGDKQKQDGPPGVTTKT